MEYESTGRLTGRASRQRRHGDGSPLRARFVPVTWVAAAMTDGDRLAAEHQGGLLPAPATDLREASSPFRIPLPAPLLRLLQPSALVRPALHVEHPPHPNIGRAVYEAWDSGYIPVNQAIAEAIVGGQAASPHRLRPPPGLPPLPRPRHGPPTRPPDARSSTSPTSPGPDPVLGLLPEFMRRRIHQDMLRRDIVGLQTRADVQNFLHCCEVIPGRRIDRLRTPAPCVTRGRRAYVRAYPISIDSPASSSSQASPEVQQSRAALRPLTGRAFYRPR